MGPLLSYETLTLFSSRRAFALLFAGGVSALHFISTLMVAWPPFPFWIMASNSWMQTPAATSRDGIFYPPIGGNHLQSIFWCFATC